jgi:DNA-binding transcriptional LysR family regulator
MELVLGTRHELGLSWVLPLLPKLSKAQPGLTTHVYFGSGPDLIHRVRTLQIDIAVTSSLLSDPKLDSARLHEEKYVFVGQPKLLKALPLSLPEHAANHTLIDVTADLALFRYWRDGEGEVADLQWGSVRRIGTIAAIRYLVLRGEGVAVLPDYFVGPDIKAKRLARIFAKVKPQSDYFRLVYRGDDPRRSIYQRIADVLRDEPLR